MRHQSDQTGGYPGLSGRVIQTKRAAYSDQTGDIRFPRNRSRREQKSENTHFDVSAYPDYSEQTGDIRFPETHSQWKQKSENTHFDVSVVRGHFMPVCPRIFIALKSAGEFKSLQFRLNGRIQLSPSCRDGHQIRPDLIRGPAPDNCQYEPHNFSKNQCGRLPQAKRAD